ncbi:MAG: alcohol dehydrogenase catalytic domain-containing protein, partial [Actinomycetota bacterium]
MRALILHGPGDLRLDEVADPHPGPGEVVLRVERALTCATDAKMLRNGAHPALPPPPAPFGHEAAGVVAEVGDGVVGVAPGDRVVVANSAPCGECFFCRRDRPSLCEDLVYLTGAFAQFLRVPARIAARNMLPVPDGVAPALAAMVEPVACAVRTAERCDARPGDVAVVLGAGVQGVVLAGLLAARGCRVVACDPHPDRRDRAVRFGAERAMDAPRDAASVAAVRAATPGGRGGDLVVEAVGRPDAWEAAVALARPGGEVVFHGGCAPGTEVRLPTHPLHYGELRLVGFYHHTPDAVRGALRLIAEGALPFAELLGDEIPLA